MTDMTFDGLVTSGSPARRFAIGSCGGLAAVCAKYVSQDHDFIMRGLSSTDAATREVALSYAYTYPILAGILVLLGGLVGWASHERSRWRLFTMGVAAPAMIGTLASGGWAADASPRTAQGGRAVLEQVLPATPTRAGEAPVMLAGGPAVTEGIKLFFGIGREVPRYRVEAGPYSDLTEAEAVVERINEESLQPDARIGEPSLEGGYLVVVGENLPYATAERLRSEFEALGLAEDLRISAGE